MASRRRSKRLGGNKASPKDDGTVATRGAADDHGIEPPAAAAVAAASATAVLFSPDAPRFDSPSMLNPLVRTYLDSCRYFGVQPDADIIVFVHFNQPVLRLRRQYTYQMCCCYRVHKIKQLELFPLLFTMIQTADDPVAFSNLQRIELRDTFMGAAAGALLAEALDKCSYKLKSLTHINLSRQPVASMGVERLLDAVLKIKSVEHLNLRRCLLGERSATMLLSFLRVLPEDHSLSHLDVRNNHISHHHIHDLVVYYKRTPGVKDRIDIELGGNQVLDEVLNATSHVAGILGSVVGIDLMLTATVDKPLAMQVAAIVYGLSLLCLYVSSTLYHSFFAMGKTLTTIFKIMDHAAIYILIAGSYTPYLLTVNDPDSPWLFVLLWSMALFGVSFHACYSGRFKQPIETTCYLVMGWIGAFKVPIWMEQYDDRLALPLILGGVMYTAGVPFFVRSRRCCEVPDHTIWHMFVLLASLLQFLAVYLYIFLPPIPADWNDRADFFVALPCLFGIGDECP